VRGANLASDRDRYRREIREPLVEMTAWLETAMPASHVRLALDRIAAATMADVPYLPRPGVRGLYRCHLRITRAQRGIIELVARLYGVSNSEALRGILAGLEEKCRQ
jgi:hypothetical protein